MSTGGLFAPTLPAREPTDGIRATNLDSLLKTGRFSDLKICCEGREFAVHKAILFAQSPVFSAECEGGFEESRTNIIRVEQFNAETVQRMLDFLYAGDYTVLQETDPISHEPRKAPMFSGGKVRTFSLNLDESDNKKAVVTKKNILSWHLSANAIGNYYNIEPLCALSRSKLRIEVNRNWSPVDFAHLLTEACTTRKTGDLKLHQLLGQVMGNHLEDLAGLQGLDALELPGVILTSIVASSLERMKSLQRHIAQQESTMRSLSQSKSAVGAQSTFPAVSYKPHRGPSLFG